MTQKQDGSATCNVPLDADLAISGPDGTVEFLRSDGTTPVSAAAQPMPEVTLEEAQRLWAEGERLSAEAMELSARADLATAQAETILRVIEHRKMLVQAQTDLEQARAVLAKAVAACDPVAAELEQVVAELSTIDPENAGNLDALLAARHRVYALNDEVEPLQRKLAERQREVDAARELVRSCQDDAIPMAQTELELAVAALVHPPFDDMAKLAEVAPLTANRFIGRIGPLLATPDRISSPHGQRVLYALLPALTSSGLLGFVRDAWLSSVEKLVDRPTYARIRAVTSPEPAQVYERYDPRQARVPDGLVSSNGLPLVLPDYDSAQAQAYRQGLTRTPYRGPIDWPTQNSYNGLRTPFDPNKR